MSDDDELRQKVLYWFVAFKRNRYNHWELNIIGTLKRIIPVIILVALLLDSFAIVNPGTRGVVVTLGKIEPIILQEGFNTKIPILQRVIAMDVTIQKVEESESTASSDLQEVTTTMAVNFRLHPDYVAGLYQNLRKEYITRVIRPNIEESLKAATAKFRAEELITKREQVKHMFQDVLEDRLKAYHIEVIAVSMTDFQFSEEFMQAIEAKVTAEQKALEAKNKLEQIRYEAQQQVIQAEAYYNATITRALGDSEAIRLLTESLTPEYLSYMALQTWDGKLPQFLGSGMVPFIQIPTTNSTATP